MCPLTDWLQPRSADFQSAVSQNCILLSARRSDAPPDVGRPADYKSAIQQIENLRYECGPGMRGSHEYVSEFAKQTTKTLARAGRSMAAKWLSQRSARHEAIT